MNISFAKNPESSSTTVAEPCLPAGSIPSCSALVPQVRAVPTTVAPTYFDDSNIDFKDVVVPRVNVVQKVGDASNIFNAGEIVLNMSAVIHVPENKEKNIPGSRPLVVVPIGHRQLQYAEKVSGGGRGLFFDTIEEVAAVNGTINYKEWKSSKGSANPKKRFEEYATFLFLVKQNKDLLPDAEHQVFPYEVDGEYYTLALWGLKGTWFTGFVKQHLFTQRKLGFLKAGGYPSFNWNITTLAKSFVGDDGEKHWAIVPVVSNGTRSTPALIEFVKNGLGFGS